MFIKKRTRIPDLYNELIRGYWKILPLYEYDDRFASQEDLVKIRALVMHKEIAPKLLDYRMKTHPFASMIKVSIHDNDNEDNKVKNENAEDDKEMKTQNEIAAESIFGLTQIETKDEEPMIEKDNGPKPNRRDYEVLFWNGSSPTQCSCFQIRKVSTDRCNYYMYYEPYKQGIDWIVYDHQTCGYEPYEDGTGVEAQIEASFQSKYPGIDKGSTIGTVTATVDAQLIQQAKEMLFT